MLLIIVIMMSGGHILVRHRPWDIFRLKSKTKIFGFEVLKIEEEERGTRNGRKLEIFPTCILYHLFSNVNKLTQQITHHTSHLRAGPFFKAVLSQLRIHCSNQEGIDEGN